MWSFVKVCFLREIQINHFGFNRIISIMNRADKKSHPDINRRDGFFIYNQLIELVL
jgi:hypothetical protein